LHVKTFAQTLDLKDDPALIAEYRGHHQRVWPEVVLALRSAGIHSMRIYLAGTRLFMTFEAPDGFDPARDFQSYADDPRCAEWDALMRTYQRQVPGTPSGAWWMPMELVFELPPT
jgi:L-rhamnose mutarotase